MEDKNFKDLFSNLGKMNIPKIESIVPSHMKCLIQIEKNIIHQKKY